MVMGEIYNNLAANNVVAYIVRLLLIVLVTMSVAPLVSWLVVKMFMLRSVTWQHVPERRLLTLRSLISGAVQLVVYLLGLIVILLTLDVPAGAILTTIGLFSAGLGFAARPLISDYLAGITLIFEDLFSVGDKVELQEVAGLVEAVKLRTTQIRAATGELYIVPNGDMRVVRNLSRGLFSVANVKVTVAAEDFAKAFLVLDQLADTAQTKLSDLIERPVFISEEGAISAGVELTLLAKAAYGRGASLRPQLMALVIEALTQAGVRLSAPPSQASAPG